MKKTEFKITKKQQKTLDECINTEHAIHGQLSLVGARKHKAWKDVSSKIPEIEEYSLIYDRTTKMVTFCHDYEERAWLKKQEEKDGDKK